MTSSVTTATSIATSSSSTTSPPEPPSPPPCDADVPNATLDALVIPDGFNAADAVAGDTVELALALPKPGPWGAYRYVRACAKWTVTPAALATVDTHGRVVIGAGAAGKTLTVTAQLANGRVLTTTIAVTKADLAPLVGNWKEDARQTCGGTQWITPEKAIRELHVGANGTFTVTWTPFESYVDYEGTFTWDASTGAMTLKPTKVNYLPSDVVAKGTATIEGGKLVLRGLWLGSAKGATEKPPCAQRFQK